MTAIRVDLGLLLTACTSTDQAATTPTSVAPPVLGRLQGPAAPGSSSPGTLFADIGARSPYAAVGIRGDRILAVGHLVVALAKRRIDAAGMVVVPGFIDPHNQGYPIWALPTDRLVIRRPGWHHGRQGAPASTHSAQTSSIFDDRGDGSPWAPHAATAERGDGDGKAADPGGGR